MSWRAMDVKEQRVRFVLSASSGERTVSGLCAEFGISRPTGYLWISRYRDSGVAGIAERSRRPHRSPQQTVEELERRGG